MLGYWLLALLLVVALPAVAYFLDYVEIYLEYGPLLSVILVGMWVLQDVLRMRRRRK